VGHSECLGELFEVIDQKSSIDFDVFCCATCWEEQNIDVPTFLEQTTEVAMAFEGKVVVITGWFGGLELDLVSWKMKAKNPFRFFRVLDFPIG
jgi:hypothetical protein